MDVIHDMVNEQKIKKQLVSKFDTIIGGGCLIMKNPNDSQSLNPYRYIILYREIKENVGNEIDFFLYIKDKKKRDDTVKYILTYGIWDFFAKIQYKYKDEYKQFNAGYIVRSCGIERIELYIKNLKNKKNQPPTSKQNFQPPQFNQPFQAQLWNQNLQPPQANQFFQP